MAAQIVGVDVTKENPQKKEKPVVRKITAGVVGADIAKLEKEAKAKAAKEAKASKATEE